MSDLVARVLKWGGIFLAVLFCGAYSALILKNYVQYDKFANDFGVYWRVANQPVELAYLWKGRFPFPYAPTMLLWVSPLALVSKWAAYLTFAACSVLAFVLACRPYLNKWQTGLCLISPPFVRGIFTGQVCAALTALLIWACGARNRIAAGVAFGVIASIKPQLVIMAPLMLALNKDWRAFVSAGATFAACVLLSLVLFGPERWSEWIGSMDHFRNAVSGTDVIRIGITPATLAERYGLNPIPFVALGLGIGFAAVYLCRDMPPLEKATAIALGSLLAAPYALAYDLVALLPFLAVVLWRGHIWAAFGMAAMFHPLPLVATFVSLMQGKWSQFGEISVKHRLQFSALFVLFLAFGIGQLVSGPGE